MSGDFRIEHDSMGDVEVPADALWRAQTQRAVQNFPISGRPLPPALIHALARIKAAAARRNADLERDHRRAAGRDRRRGRRDRRRAPTTSTSRSTSSRPAPARART
jgi:fumarate hydratase class II